MNSLTYLSRQFDVLASAKTPPSTPTSSKSAFIDDSHINDSQPLKHTEKLTTETLSFITIRHDVRLAPPEQSVIFDGGTEDSAKQGTMYTQLTGRVSTEVSKKGKEKEVIPDVIVEEPMEEDTATRLVSSLNAPALLNRHHTDPLALPSNTLLHYSQPPTPPNESRSGSRSPTPVLHSRKPLKTLVLDLDETLIHSTSRPMPLNSSASGFFGFSNIGKRNIDAGHTVEVILGGKRTVYHVYKRPFVDFFLRTVSSWYTLVIFTASMREYADPVIDWLDAGRGILGQRLFRDSCTLLDNGQYTKNLTIVDEDLSRVCLIDNSPISYRVNEANGIPIEGWTSDPSDEALLDLLPVLDSLRFTSDVRRVLGLRSAGVNMMIHS
ncbi:hypothetical protein ONZ45_g9319 [Pleurotus djamor]|nr:hypothetical protein ONZ45_g9319 [Pleurotus djamor]